MSARLSILAATPLFLLLAVSDASAQNYPWCANYSMWGGGSRNCGFVTYQQCMATVSGVGGFCEQNFMYRPNYARAPRKVQRRRH